jgi:hypothetical protein
MNANPYEVIIVGSGAGGAAAGHRLALGGVRVLIVEKGAELPADGSTLDDIQVVMHGRFLSREPWLDGMAAPYVPKSISIWAARRAGTAPPCCVIPRRIPGRQRLCRARLAHRAGRSRALLRCRPSGCSACAPFAIEPSLKRILEAIAAVDRCLGFLSVAHGLVGADSARPAGGAPFRRLRQRGALKGDAESSFLNPVALLRI